MDLKREGRQIALALVNVDDLVLAQELSGNSISFLSFAGRSLVGTAVAGAGMVTRAAVLGAQFATKSALAVAGAAKGRIPGAGIAEQLVYDLDQRVGHGGESASFIASQGIALGKSDGKPPTEPIFGDAWLGKRLKPGATPTTVLVESVIDLTRLAALPLTLGTTTIANALASPTGHQVTRSFWDAVSMIVDTVVSRSGSGGTRTDRSERRATLLMVGITPLMTTVQDIVDFGEGLTRASAGDGRQLRALLTTALERIDASPGASDSTGRTPSRVFSALEESNAEGSRFAALGKAIVEDRGALSRLAVAYTTLVAGLLTSSLQSVVNGARDVGSIEAWVRADEAAFAKAAGNRGTSAEPGDLRAAPSGATTPNRPASVKQLETLVAAFYTADADTRRRGFYVPSTIELALDTIFSYSYRALGREASLARMERLFGAAVRNQLRDDCSLRGEIIDAKIDRDVRIAALVSQLQGEGHARLRQARDHAADRLASLTATSPDRMLERLVPQRIGQRIAILQRFVGMADTANALDPLRQEEARRQRVVEQFNEWLATPPAAPAIQLA